MRFLTLTYPLSADNHGEGGFSLLCFGQKKKLMVDCPSNYWRKCLADGIITLNSVSSAVEGIRTITLT
jgi:K+ transporter